jgi:UDP-glucose 4-epimerase
VTWLVTGGAGYIGAHVVAGMRAAGHDVVVLDDLSTGDASRIATVPLVTGSVLDGERVRRVLRDHRVSGIVHVAAKKQVEESVRRPLHYYRENVEGLRVVLEAAVTGGIEFFVYSSSASVYGSPDVDLVTEAFECRPVNPYGRTKLIGEHMVADVAAATGMRWAALRYFNVVGAAAPELADRAATNLVPMVFRQLSTQRPPHIFGTDYPTPDGTCVRDFVHAVDVASAHLAAARGLEDGRVRALTANVGSGQGVSVREMVDLVLRITGTADEQWARPVLCARRPGDAARIVAATDAIRGVLGWKAQYDVEQMVASAWEGWTASARG